MEENWEDRTCKVVYTCVSLCIFMYAMSGCSLLLIHDVHAYVFICYGHRISDINDGGVHSISARLLQMAIENSCSKTAIPVLISMVNGIL